MPITPAHAAAAWPLHRADKRLPLSALVIGTLAPDLEYLLRLRPEGKFGHSPAGLVVFCIPVTLLLFWGWRSFVRPALVPLLPPGVRRTVETPPPGRRSDQLPLAIVAALLGTVTHVLWDGFTHRAGWGVAVLPVLADYSPIAGFTWYSVAQFGSSLLGMLVVLLWITLTLRRFPPEARAFAPGQRTRLAVAVLVITAVTLAVALANARVATDLVAQLERGAIGAEIGFGAGLVLYAAYARARRLTASR